MLTILAGAAVAPALEKVRLFFPDASVTLIKMVITLPSIFIIIFTLISGKLLQWLHRKKVLYFGLVLYTAGGVLSGFANDIYTLLLFRAVLGIGVGLIMPLSTGLIIESFEGRERTSMMGLSTGMSSFSGIVTSLLSGWLATFSWRYSFAVYLLGIVSLVLIVFGLPSQKERDKRELQKEKMPVRVYRIAFLALLVTMAFYSIPTGIALYLRSEQFGDAQFAGIIMAVFTFAGFIAGMMFSYFIRIFQRFSIPAALLLMSLGFSGISLTESSMMLVFCVLMAGLAVGFLYPTFMLKTGTHSPPVLNMQAMSITGSALFLGQFVSPIFTDTLGLLFSNPSGRFSYGAMSVYLFILAIVYFFWFLGKKEW